MRTDWKGFYYDGVTAKRHDADIVISSHGLIIKTAEKEVEWLYASITQTQGRYESEDVRLEKGDEALVIHDRGFLVSLRAIAPSVSSRFRSPEGSRKLLLRLPIIASVVIAFAVAAYFWIIPGASDFIADNLPLSFEEKLGESFTEELQAVMPECKALGATMPVVKIVERLSAAADSPYRFKVHVLTSPLVNAFAAPGGQIVVFSGLLEKTRTPEELAGVLAHEMEHVVLRHSTKSMVRSLSTSMLLSIVLGDGAMTGAVHSLGAMRYSRGFEEEADRAGAELLIRAGVDPRGMIRFFEGLEKESSNTSGAVRKAAGYLSSHPLTGDRARYLEELLRGREIKTSPLLPGTDWDKAKKGCS